MSDAPARARPVVIAHRAGNRLDRLARAKAIGADLAELDVWLRRGRLEVRHARAIGPLPLLREGWRVTPAWPRLELDAVLEAADGLPLMVDLKTESPALSRAVIAAFERRLPGAPRAVTARAWRLLAPFEGMAHVRLLPSAAWPDELAALMPELGGRFRALSLHATLARPDAMRELAARGVEAYVWPVNTRAELARALAVGAAGVNGDDLDLLAAVVAGTALPRLRARRAPLRSQP